jgi:beta-lactamase regulating signal transducer with metallopeptidase domain
MLAWMLYMMMVALLLSAGAWLAERAVRVNRGRTRGIWAAAIAASLCAPVVLGSLHGSAMTVRHARTPADAPAASDAITRSVSPALWIAAVTAKPRWSRDYDAALGWVWRGASLLTLLVLLGSYAHLQRRMRQWRPATIAGIAAWISGDAGPAVVGFLRPRIVVPRWLTQASPAQQAAIMAHEQSHLIAGDARLFALALLALVMAPWNLPLWWQLRRLRRAIEIDCDARVLDGGIDAASYGETLICAGERQSAHIAAIAATSGSRSFLEQRIRIMTHRPVKWRRTASAVLGAASLCVAALAAQLSPPAEKSAAPAGAASMHATRNAAGRSAVKLPAETLDRYVGDYAQGDSAFVTVTRQGDGLLADFSSGPKMELLAAGVDQFFVKDGHAEVIFANDGSDAAPSAVVRQMNTDLPLTRVDAATVARFKARLQARVQRQAPAPGSEAALRRLYAGIESGNPDYEHMQPLLAEALRRDLGKFMAEYQALGTLQSIGFAGVDGGGWDVYDVQRANGRLQDRIIVGGDGKIAGYFTTQP